MNNYKKFITKNTQIPLMFRSLIKDFYVVDAQEILCNIAQNNHYFINQIDPDENTLKFGLGSFAALSDYLNFEHNYYPTFETLYLYLTYNVCSARKSSFVKKEYSFLNNKFSNYFVIIIIYSVIMTFFSIFGLHDFPLFVPILKVGKMPSKRLGITDRIEWQS